MTSLPAMEDGAEGRGGATHPEVGVLGTGGVCGADKEILLRQYVHQLWGEESGMLEKREAA